jgi:peptide/nickel transport system substrate-binding protein
MSGLSVTRFLAVVVYDTLFEYKEPDLGDVIPRLAESWTRPNPTTLVIKIKRGVRFHNGVVMTAGDVKFSLDRVRNAKTGSLWAGFYDDIDRIDVVDAQTVRLRLKRPSATLPGILTHPSASILPRAYVEGGGDPKTRPVGTGAFSFVRREGPNLFFIRNKNYYRRGLPYVDELVWRVVPDVNAIASGLRAGDIDVNVDAASTLVPTFQRLSNFQVVAGISGSFVPLFLNVRSRPLNDWRVRQAIAWAVNRDEIMKVGRGGLGVILPAGPIGPPHWAALKQPIFKQDYEKARALLREAGLAEGFKLTITIWSELEDKVRVAEAIKEQLRPLNIEVDIQTKEQATYFDQWNRKEISTVLGWNGLVDPSEYAERFRSNSPTNKYYFSDARIDQLAAQGTRELNQTKRYDIYAQLQKRLADLSPAVFLYADMGIEIAAAKVRGVKFSFTEQPFFLRDAWLVGCR